MGSAYGAAVMAHGPTSYFKLNEAAGNFADQCGLDTLVPSGFVAGDYQADPGPFIGSGAAPRFDGVNNKAVSTRLSNQTPWAQAGNHTILFWAKVNSIAGSHNEFLSCAGAKAWGIGVDTYVEGSHDRIRYNMSGDPNSGTGLYPMGGGGGWFATEAWHFYAIVRQGTTVTIYQDDAYKAAGDPADMGAGHGTGDAAYDAAAAILGADPNSSHFFDGWMSHVAIIPSALTEAQVKALYAAGIDPDPMDIYYTNAAADADWNTAGNWFADAGGVTPAGHIPSDADRVHLVETFMTTGPALAVSVDTIDFNGCQPQAALFVNLTVTGSATNFGGGQWDGNAGGAASFGLVAQPIATILIGAVPAGTVVARCPALTTYQPVGPALPSGTIIAGGNWPAGQATVWASGPLTINAVAALVLPTLINAGGDVDLTVNANTSGEAVIHRTRGSASLF